MERTRNESKWDFTHYASVDDFLSEKRSSGAHAIQINDTFVDILVENRGASCTLVVFTASVSTARSEYPVFTGARMAREAGANLVSIADPAIAEGVNIGWHLGTSRTGKLQPTLLVILRKLLKDLDGRKNILFGASGGGYAAMLYGQNLDDCIVLAVNPRLDLGALPKAQADKFLRTCWGRLVDENVSVDDLSFLEELGSVKLADHFHDGKDNPTLIYQNLEDRNFLLDQVLPFVRKNWNADNLLVRFENDGAGHVRIPTERVDDIVAELCADSGTAESLERARFFPAAVVLADLVNDYAGDNRAMRQKSLRIKELEMELATAQRDVRRFKRLRRAALKQAELAIEQAEASRNASGQEIAALQKRNFDRQYFQSYLGKAQKHASKILRGVRFNKR